MSARPHKAASAAEPREKTLRAWLREFRAELIVWLALMLLAAATFVLAYLPLGPFHPLTSMGIAVAKALVVALFFMHLKRESATIRLAAAAGLVFLGVLFTLTLADYLSRPPGVELDAVRATRAQTPQQP
ncbi:cytochrome C oxidase subunit IV family protein [Mangrovicella endophytica]|uniref:cytochrome C oxidase subunit IV family protein n=1 Tax=Mangrovicella endophytica TaxID=2066697 RepID=UPI000C9E0108|nr:cytochrome C oxidase subunit IV family protein [Mangrovicella endophytica]